MIRRLPWFDRSGPTPTSAPSARFWEIDALRAVAILMMIVYHLLWDLWFFRVLPEVDLYHGFWKYFQRTTATLFLTLAGVSLAVTAMRLRAKGTLRYGPFLRRGLRVFGWGMVLSVVVWAAGVGYVHFGVLHLIGFAILAAYPLLGYTWINLALWALFNLAGYLLLEVRVDYPWLLWLGLTPQAYAPNDYFPVIPWFGVVLLGVFLGNLLYTPQGLIVRLPDLSRRPLVRGMVWMGQHSLPIYLLHQPVLFALLWATGVIKF